MFEGDLEEGELEIGQVATLINTIISAEEVVNELVVDFQKAVKELES